jgi:hypothetical protein
MEIKLVRRWASANATIGELSIATAAGDTFECFTLEDVVRPDGVKVKGKTAVPRGRYRVTLEPSPKFHGAIRPRLHDVPDFEGILIHEGNTAENSEGCILVGRTRREDFIGESRFALKALQEKLDRAAAAGEAIAITITSQPAREG